jgi:hypothetical protein
MDATSNRPIRNLPMKTVNSILAFSAAVLSVALVAARPAYAAENQTVAHFRDQIASILEERCYQCHGYGEKSGGIAFDELKTDEQIADPQLWWRVLKNVRSGIMPPPGEARPTDEERQKLERWIKYDAFAVDPNDVDPGRVTIRRLNRLEYRNTVRDLMGIDFNTEEEFSPDDTGYGFDNIGEVLSVSPLLLEKYMHAAEAIVSRAVPRVAKVVPEQAIDGKDFRGETDKTNPQKLSFYDQAQLAAEFESKNPGDYRLALEVQVNGNFESDPGRCRLVLKIDDQERLSEELSWHDNKRFTFNVNEKWEPGKRRFSLQLEPLTPPEKKKNSLDLRIVRLKIDGPLDKHYWTKTKNYERFFTRDESPADAGERKTYTREVLSRFAIKAYRRPVDDDTIDRLVSIAEGVYSAPGKVFEDGIAQAMIAVLASPRFLFRSEGEVAGEAGAKYPSVDEYALASRLSYYLWSTMPDDELFQLAEKGELRKNLPQQLDRMLKDPRSRELIDNFAGQWLQLRDIDGVQIDARRVLARDAGEDRDFQRQQEERRAQFARIEKLPEAERQKEFEKLREQFGKRRRNRGPNIELDGELRRAMRRESEMLFAHIVREDKSVLELINADYTFLNERLARHYAIPDVTGQEMRRVSLASDSPRGGILTHGSVLIVTSNPTRTSPVKRGLFVLDNILGTPPPPPPADIPQLEESEKGFKDREPTLREVLALHRENVLCSSCHSRMDPLGLALENFNALGMWREQERKQPIDAAGQLITGESFNNIRELKQILVTSRRTDFYRCLTEKMLTYALGRGLDYNDVETVDRIVERLEKENGRFSALLTGIVESSPFQRRRSTSQLASVDKSTTTQSASDSGTNP